MSPLKVCFYYGALPFTSGAEIYILKLKFIVPPHLVQSMVGTDITGKGRRYCRSTNGTVISKYTQTSVE